MMSEDLVDRVQPSGGGRLLDLACGTGRLAFAFANRFVEVWAVDQEPDMLRVVETKPAAAGIGQVRAIVSPAEDLDAQPGSFEVVIGNAFHRLPQGTGRQPGAQMAASA
jgi:ubiquinone/menaquinone biosynthesis C-methylase UbiE